MQTKYMITLKPFKVCQTPYMLSHVPWYPWWWMFLAWLRLRTWLWDPQTAITDICTFIYRDVKSNWILAVLTRQRPQWGDCCYCSLRTACYSSCLWKKLSRGHLGPRKTTGKLEQITNPLICVQQNQRRILAIMQPLKNVVFVVCAVWY